MDQLRTMLAWLKKQHFWVLSVLVALIGIACWWKASGTLSSEFVSNKGAIEGEFSSLKQTQGKPFLPNQTIIDKQKEEIKNQAKGVAETWQKLYDRQREHVLEWPTDLSQEFRDHVEKLKFGDDIPRHLLNDYQNYARRYFPELPKIVGARVYAEGEGAYGEGGGIGRGAYSGGGSERGAYGEGGLGAGQPEELQDDFICEWLDQNVVRDALIFKQRPSALRIWVTQEDLWVYKTLLNVIRRTNEAAGATRQSNAAVRVIYSLEVGRTAGLSSRGKGRIYMLPSAAPAADAMLGEGGEASSTDAAVANAYGQYGGGGERGGIGPMMGEGGRMGGEGYGATGGPMTPEQERATLLSYRYLDATGKPLPVGGGEMGTDPAALDPSATPAASASPTEFGLEYKRLPVRMTLQMDQRWLSHLISECANQPLQVEVQEVRINPSDLGSTGGGGEGRGSQSYSGGGNPYGGGSPYGGGGMGRGYDGGGAGSSLFPERTGIQTFSAQPNIVDVVVQGIIYIFNEPNPDVLKTSDDAQLASTN
jgi:hypothetical protein